MIFHELTAIGTDAKETNQPQNKNQATRKGKNVPKSYL